MTLSKKILNLSIWLSLSMPFAIHAEDIDLYQGGAEITGNRPNVLIILDNSANWSAANQGWDGGIKQGESELNALINAIGAQTSGVRVGLMMFTDAGPNGGYMRFGIREMNATNRDGLTTMIAGMKPNFNDPTEKVASAKTNYSNVMYEAYRYFGGGTHYAANDSKRDYTYNGAHNVSPYTAGDLPGNAFSSAAASQYNTPLSADAPCSKNYIIFIGNGFPSQDTSPTALGDPNLVFSGDTSNANYFDTTQITTASSATNANFADEWARFLKEKGTQTVCNTANDGTQTCANSKVVTYTIDVYKDQQDTIETALLKSMANVGGGTYCHASSEDGIKTCLNNIFNDTQAVDSVFTSASLPVSVNTQGTYLNQIYMGVFRPDNGGHPRWIGNLKEYRFGLTTDANGNDTIYLADSTDTNGVPPPAVNNVTGFISQTAVSYWTSSVAPAQGFWAFKPSGKGGEYDSPDGDLVEKGAAAQKLRTLGHAARTIYTCPSAGCTANTVPSSFDINNASVVTSLTGTQATITSLIRSGTTVTVNMAANIGLASPTDTVTISGSSVAAYNATWTVTPISSTQFTFTIAETPVTPATGSTITVSAGSDVTKTATSVTYDSTSGSPTYGKVRVYLPNHGFISNQSITIQGATGTAANMVYNGTFAITVMDSDNFCYTPTLTTSESPAPIDNSISGGTTSLGTVNCGGSTFNIAKIRRDTGSSTVTVVTTSNSSAKCKNPATLAISGLSGTPGSSYNGSNYSVSSTDSSCPNYANMGSNSNNTFCYTTSVSSISVAPSSPAAGTLTATGKPTRLVASIIVIVRTDGNASNVATVTVTTAVDHGFSGASSILINGADQSDYNGTKTTAGNNLQFPTSNTITFTLATGPSSIATGGSVARGSSVDPSTLINWTRGMDNKEDENQNNSLTDTRASVHGDVLHSRPVVINYGGNTGLVANYGANDGAVHAVKAGNANTDGTEKWAFIAPEHYSQLGRLYNNSPVIKFPTTSPAITPTPVKRNYFFDGNIGVYQSPDLATTHIFATMRRGGRVIYAFDVSNPDLPKFLWKKTYTDTGFSELGYTWSEPKVVLLKKTSGVTCSRSDPSSYTRALIFGAGYDPTEEDKDNQGTAGVVRNPTMGRGVFVVNAATGALIKLLQPSDNKKYSFPADVTLLDTDSDGCVDRVYAVDTGAQIHRFDIGDADNNNWKAYKLAALGDIGNDGGSDDSKFLYPADSELGYLNGVQTTFIMVGSGNREVPRDENVTNMFFMVKDTVQPGTDPASVTAVQVSNLTQVTNFNSNTTTNNTTNPSFKGWYITLDTGEKVVNTPLTVAGVTYFGTNTPKQASLMCTPNLGIARGYQINYLNGTSSAGVLNNDGSLTKSDLYTNFAGC